jgi:hypothetical protein
MAQTWLRFVVMFQKQKKVRSAGSANGYEGMAADAVDVGGHVFIPLALL